MDIVKIAKIYNFSFAIVCIVLFIVLYKSDSQRLTIGIFIAYIILLIIRFILSSKAKAIKKEEKKWFGEFLYKNYTDNQ